MKIQSLNGAWRLSIPGSAFPETEATVPGSVYHDLLTAGLIPDPFWRDNEPISIKNLLPLTVLKICIRQSLTENGLLIR